MRFWEATPTAPPDLFVSAPHRVGGRMANLPKSNDVPRFAYLMTGIIAIFAQKRDQKGSLVGIVSGKTPDNIESFVPHPIRVSS